MWPKLRRASMIKRDEKELRDGRKSLNVNEEYFSALRTNSYADFFTKAQSLVNHPSSSPSHSCHHKFSELLLEPCQDSIPALLESAIILARIPELKGLVHNYFDISAEASKICTHLLKSISQIQSNFLSIQPALDAIDEFSSVPQKVKSIILELNSFISLNNPFSNPNYKHDFKVVHEKYKSVLQHLKSKREKVARRIKLIKCFKKASGICMTAACGLIAVTAIVLAAHTLTALLMGPAIFSFPIKSFKKKIFRNFKFFRIGFLRKVGKQLDVAAKGTYILDRDFDTMSRLVARLHDEVEHRKAMLQFCLERREDRFSLQVVKELKKSNVGFRKQVEELEEMVCLCLVTINRARALVIKEVTTSCAEEVRHNS